MGINKQFKPGDMVVYPSHGIGRVTEITASLISGVTIDAYVVSFDKIKMTLRVPTRNAAALGMRKIGDSVLVEKVLSILRGKFRKKRGVWSRKAAEYELKISSGDLVSLAEVVRELHSEVGDKSCCYSQLMMYEKAVDSIIEEFVLIKSISKDSARAFIMDALNESVM